MSSNVIMLFTGKGKGKTTAAVGQAIRYVGAGNKVLFVQFLKSGESSEVKPLKQLGIKTLFNKSKIKMPIDLNSKTIVQNQLDILDESLEIIRSGKFIMTVFDELGYVCSSPLILREEIIEKLREAKKYCDIVITGRNSPGWLIEISDLVSEVKNIKHYFKKGINAKRGREY